MIHIQVLMTFLGEFFSQTEVCNMEHCTAVVLGSYWTAKNVAAFEDTVILKMNITL